MAVVTSSNRMLFQQVWDLSAGTVSYLIDCTNYDIIYTVKREFAFWCLRNTDYDNWIQAWKVFSHNPTTGAGPHPPHQTTKGK